MTSSERELLPAPSTPATPPRGPFLIALLYLVKQGTSAPQESKDYIKTVVGVGSQVFPGTCNVGDILKGATQQRVLEDAGVVAKSSSRWSRWAAVDCRRRRGRTRT